MDLSTPALVRAAATKLKQQKSSMAPEQFALAMKPIDAAAKKFNLDLGVDDVHADGALPAKKKGGLHIRADIVKGGSLHVRHLSNGSYGLPSVAISRRYETGPNGERLVWNQLAKSGTFKGHPAGPFQLNTGVFQDIIQNFEREGQDIPIDHEHLSEMPPEKLPPGGAPAQGWITKLTVRNGELWGLVKWNEAAREQIDTDQYRFFSPAVRFNSKDRVTAQPIGARMSSGAMTNSPYLVGMEQLAASEGAAAVLAAADPGAATMRASRLSSMRAASMNDFMPKARAALKMSELATPTECSDQAGRLRDLYAVAPHARANMQGVDLGGYTDALCGLMGLPANASIEDVLDALGEMLDDAQGELDGAMPSQPTEIAADGGDDGGADMTMSDSAVPAETNTIGVAATTLSAKEDESKMDQTKDLEMARAEVVSLTSKCADLEKKATSLEAQNAFLMSWKEAEEMRAVTLRVDEAFDTYRQPRSLTDAQKPSMLALCKADTGAFDTLFPRIKRSEQHLMSDLTGSRKDAEVVASTEKQASTSPAAKVAALRGEGVPSIKCLTDKFVGEGKSIDDATNLAFKEHQTLLAQSRASA